MALVRKRWKNPNINEWMFIVKIAHRSLSILPNLQYTQGPYDMILKYEPVARYNFWIKTHGR